MASIHMDDVITWRRISTPRENPRAVSLSIGGNSYGPIAPVTCSMPIFCIATTCHRVFQALVFANLLP